MERCSGEHPERNVVSGVCGGATGHARTDGENRSVSWRSVSVRGRFPPGEGLIRKFLHERLDPLHWDHHARPFDGSHISGGLKDILPLFFVAAPVSFLFPVYTAPVVLAGAVQSYACEEWLHYALHFSNSRFPLFRRMKKYHLYHHSPRGIDKGYGITTRFWDGVFDTRFPEAVRRSLSKN
jgi:hypothetical protein